MQKDITVLDCTLRDGGYYNNWDFSPEIVDAYLRALSSTGVDVVEVGFRFMPKDQFLGPFAYTTDEFLAELRLPQGIIYGVMVNASDLVKYTDGPASAVDQLFGPASESPISLVRIAAHFSEIEACKEAVSRLKNLGYRVGFNLMQAGRQSSENIAKAARMVKSWGAVEVLYFADSLGNMSAAQISSCVKSLADNWGGAVGLHAHDNIGLALNNTVVALDSGATWVDATILGMGRGAGNARTEFLLCELVRRGLKQYDPDGVLSLVMGEFKALQKRYDWGSNLLYYMSAIDDIHPTYVQMMQSDQRYDLSDVLGALKALKEMEGHSFSLDSLGRAMNGKTEGVKGAWSAENWLQGKDVLLLGAGPSGAQHRDALIKYIENHEPAVISLNTTPPIPHALITAFAACHPTRILMDASHYSELTKPIIIPTSSLPGSVREKLKDVEHLDYGVSVAQGKFNIESNTCEVPILLVAAYALAVATSAGANRILLAGFDGFNGADLRQSEMVEVFEAYYKVPGALPIIALTPTSYPVQCSSVYAPNA